jgi:hypothetical protein
MTAMGSLQKNGGLAVCGIGANLKNGWTSTAIISIQSEHFMNEIIVFLLFIGIWVLLQAVILPRLGVST